MAQEPCASSNIAGEKGKGENGRERGGYVRWRGKAFLSCIGDPTRSPPAGLVLQIQIQYQYHSLTHSALIAPIRLHSLTYSDSPLALLTAPWPVEAIITMKNVATHQKILLKSVDACLFC